jgi:hypothetical protein
VSEVLFIVAGGWQQSTGISVSREESATPADAVVVAYLAGGCVGMGGGIPDGAIVVEVQRVRGHTWRRVVKLVRTGPPDQLASWSEVP